MKYEKTYYKSLALSNGFKWAFFDKGLHSFTKKTSVGYIECRVNDDDIEQGAHITMMDKGFTR